MREFGGRLFRLWVLWTGALAAAVLVIGFLTWWGSGFRLAAVGAGLVDVWIAYALLRSWLRVGVYRSTRWLRD